MTAGGRLGSMAVSHSHGLVTVDVYSSWLHGVRVLSVGHQGYFDRAELYGEAGVDYADNAARFAFLSQAAVEWLRSAQPEYDVVHAHDWQSGLVPVLFQGATVFTIHNLAYQGLFEIEWLRRIGLSPGLMRMDGLEYWGRASYLKAGIVFSRMLTTVSPRYATEIQTDEYGFGFEGILRNRSGHLVGILNGIDYDEWNPAADPHVPVSYDASTLEKKRDAKRHLLGAVNLPQGEHELRRPLVGMVSRLVDQKGFDLIAAAVDDLLRNAATFVLLGSGDRRHEDLWQTLAQQYPDRVAAYIGFNETLAHQIEAGADIFLMPSRFEPCGLNQMYSLRYGTVPVVRAVGGLYDTVRNFDPATGRGTGFTFEAYTPAALVEAVGRALTTYADMALWRRIQTAGMALDLSWDESARKYVEVYERATIEAAR
jgi:starch synthase